MAKNWFGPDEGDGKPDKVVKSYQNEEKVTEDEEGRVVKGDRPRDEEDD